MNAKKYAEFLKTKNKMIHEIGLRCEHKTRMAHTRKKKGTKERQKVLCFFFIT
jgi:hypothetical protein